MKTDMKQWGALVLFLLLTFSVSGIGGLFTSRSVGTWYQTLRKPSWSPPDWVFSPVWITLYAMMAVAAWLVWRKGGFARFSPALVFFSLQLLLNALWSFLFFGLRSPGAGLADIIPLWIAILATTVLFWRVSTAAGLLFVPYLGWVGFALALNLSLWRLNT